MLRISPLGLSLLQRALDWSAPLPAVSQQSLKFRVEFQKEVERVARLMCEEMGLDPEDTLTVELSSILLPFELNEIIKNSSICARRWETMRPHAAVALAGFRAVNRYFLAEK